MTAAVAQAQWSRFRGPGGAGLAPDSAPLPAVLDLESNLAWRCPLPPGGSSPCVQGKRIYLTGYEDETLVTIAIDRASGDVAWRRAAPAKAIERHHEIHSPAAPTPTSDGERVYVYFGSFGLLCYDLDGAEVWRHALPPPKNTFGTASSPILAGGFLVLVHDSNEESFVLALDPATGETAWRTERPGFRSGWSTPAVWRRSDTEELLVYGDWWLTAYDARDGSERWSVPGLTDEPIVTPATGDGLVFVTSYNMRTNPEVIGRPQFDVLLAELDRDGDQRIDASEAAANESVLSRHDADGEGDHPLRIFFRFLDEDRDGGISAQEWPKLAR